jgi:hypothetical protein
LWAVYGDYTADYNCILDSYGISKFNANGWLNIPYKDVLAQSLTRILVNPSNENEVYASSFFLDYSN